MASGASMLIDVERGPRGKPPDSHKVNGTVSVKAPGPSRTQVGWLSWDVTAT